MLAACSTIRRSVVARSATTASATALVRGFSSKPVATKDGDEDAVNPYAEKREKMAKANRYLVFGAAGDEYMPAPILPDTPGELAAIDEADRNHRTTMDGVHRTVVIRQQGRSMRQSPLNPEMSWRIFFYEDGIAAETWENPLMGWVSNADPYQCGNPLIFTNAAEAVYFAKKRGWKYVVKHPILREMRDDDAQYQDNFLPQAIAAKVKAEGTSCKEWERKSAGTSHYFRPLKYHGDGLVRQHGPNFQAESAKPTEGYYKMR
jgi:ETC complex I subunit conserved region